MNIGKWLWKNILQNLWQNGKVKDKMQEEYRQYLQIGFNLRLKLTDKFSCPVIVKGVKRKLL